MFCSISLNEFFFDFFFCCCLNTLPQTNTLLIYCHFAKYKCPACFRIINPLIFSKGLYIIYACICVPIHMQKHELKHENCVYLFDINECVFQIEMDFSCFSTDCVTLFGIVECVDCRVMHGVYLS